ncbi:MULTISPECIES: transcriptional repressor [unclassified Acinetobacter]|uniref:Transcriptional repressor n=1 Tax=Acinetobacter corruptisaponis TaxID=3045147 RepID=A0ABY8S2Q7_9GAMM|nr:MULTISPECIES: transcriptional repressor [unclassified Acinetobacter]MDH0031300.1 transcriptional repressor [Acinetobacter sp. GD04021]MDH0887045.1 transcriptional repressor [Acinetobacter sp. GD03873]MDH1083496.1 transcriptional repressor [Acinetobacter sp. GD03983]MDH2190361.1 transcriptional repressor [Acinetobacter sp. GD03645]MDH2203696.1 transcriptional repressor [Acinetobacter sp. GD03647]
MNHTVNMDELVKKLRAAKVRATLPRLLILRILSESNQAMTAYEIEKAVAELNSTLFLTSIYTVLRSLEQANIIQRYHKPGERQAVFSIGTQSGSVICECIKCKKRIEVDQRELDQNLQQFYQQQQLNVKSYNLIIQVECKECT